MSTAEMEELARELLSAYQTGEMVSPPPSARYADFDLDAAYAVEAEIRRLRQQSGRQAAGRKVGYANKAIWRVLKLETLVWAHMYDDTVHYSNGNCAEVALPQARSLKVEPEVVFGLKQPLTELMDGAAALQATDWLAIGFEIIDCPFPGWQFQPSDFVASMGLHAALVIGERRQVTPELVPTLLDCLPRFKVHVLKNGEMIEEGSGKSSLRSPAACLAELGGAIVRRSPAEPLRAGEIISSGTLTAGHEAQAGDLWAVEVQDLPLPKLTLRLS
jgi:2-oxo-3-hexenedioate decarboxylase